MKTKFLLFCDYLVYDQQMRFSIIGIFRNVFGENIPTRKRFMHVLALVEGNKDDVGKKYIGKIIIEYDKNKNIKVYEADIEFELGNTKDNMLLPQTFLDYEAYDLVFEYEGRYNAVLLINEKVIETESFYVYKNESNKK
jgi:hypothetical protein